MTPPLSTTRLLEQLNNQKFSDFIDTVREHFKLVPNDEISSVKAIKVVSSFAYKSPLPPDVSGDLVSSLSTCVTELPTSTGDSVLRELYGNLVHVMNRLVVQNTVGDVPQLCSVFFNIYHRLKDKSTVQMLSYNLYVNLWNLSTKFAGSSVGEEKRRIIQTQFMAVNFLLSAPTADKFSLSKCVEKTRSVASSALFSEVSEITFDLVFEQMFLILENSMLEREIFHKWDVWSLLLNLCVKHKRKVQETLKRSLDTLGAEFSGEISFIKLMTSVVTGQESNFVKLTNLEVQDRSVPALLTLLETLCPTLPSSLLSSYCHNSLLLTSKTGITSTALPASRLLASLTGQLVTCFKADQQLVHDSELVRVALACVESQAEYLKLLQGSAEDKQVRSCVSCLSTASYNMAVIMFNMKQFTTAKQLLQVSCDSCLTHKQLTTSVILRPRYKLLADTLLKLSMFKEFLGSLMVCQLLTLADDKMEKVQKARDKLTEAGKLWCFAKREWARTQPEQEAQVHEVTVVRLAREQQELVGRLNLGKDVVLRLARVEVGWYRGQAHSFSTLDLTQSRVQAAGDLLGVSSLQLDQGMVLLEQAWVFWLGGNVEDLETGVKCAEKAEKLLEEDALGRGLSKYWRYACQHQLLMVQVQRAVQRAQEVRSVQRKEREGLQGEEEREGEGDVTPAFPGLEMSVQYQLVDLLEGALDCWERKFAPSDWVGEKVVIDFMLSIGWHLDRLGHSGARAFSMVMDMARGVVECQEHEVMAGVELIRLGRLEELKGVVDTAKLLEERKNNSAIGCQAGLGVAYCARSRGQWGLVKEVVGSMLASPVVTQKTLTFNLLESEVRLLASQVRQQPGQWVRSGPTADSVLDQSGPLELALDAWKMSLTCCKWTEEDQASPPRQDPSLLWLVPRTAVLQLRCLQRLGDLFSNISAPRELRCYLKQALQLAQVNCLPLQTASVLVSLAQANLLCDDPAAASVQLAGVEFVLGLSRQQEKQVVRRVVSKVDSDTLVKLPGQEDQSMSPALARPLAKPPPFLSHPPACKCTPCHLDLLHLTLPRLAFTQASVCHMEGELELARSHFNHGQEITDQLLKKIGTSSTAEPGGKGLCNTAEPGGIGLCNTAHLQNTLVEGLLVQIECWGRERRWAECFQLISLCEGTLSKLRGQVLVRNMAIVLGWLEMRDFARTGQVREEERVRNKVQASLANRMEGLDIGGGSTPSTDKQESKTHGAPSKRVLPPLGVGNPETLARKLEESLNLANTESSSPSTSPKLKTVSRVPRRPKLISSLELLNENLVKPLVPKILVTAGTPRRFFKSKAGSTSSTPPKVDISLIGLKFKTKVKSKTTATSSTSKLEKDQETSAKSGTSESVMKPDSATKSRTSSLVRKPDFVRLGSSNRSSVKKPDPVKPSLNENVYVYDEFSATSPIASTSSNRKTSRTSVRKVPRKVEVPALSASVKKPPRMASLSEKEPPSGTRSSSRKKTAVKRL